VSDGLFGFGSGGGGLSGDGAGGGDPMGHLDPTLRQDTLRRWEVRALQWRAVALAEAAFDGPVRPRLLAEGPQGPFRGLLELEVPFASLEAHREAEASFLDAAGRDELLGPRRLVFVFRPGSATASASDDADEAA
jgi:hypothetical protein